MSKFRFSLLFIFISFSLNVDAQFGLQGSAERFDTDCYQLTSDSLTFGRIFSNRVINLNNPVTLYTELFFGSEDNGGDGIAFFFQGNNQDSVSVNPTFGLGMNQPSIAVEFDTYQDVDTISSNGDPNFDHIALIRDGDFNHSSTNNLQGPFIANNSGDIEDDSWHSVKIDWQPSTNMLTVYFDCEEKINYQIDLIEEVFGGEAEVFYGFSASTFLAQNQQEVCVVVNTLNYGGEDVVICSGGKTQILSIRGGESYEWTPAEGLNNAMAANPVASPSSDIVYSLTVNTGYCDEVLDYEINIGVSDTSGPVDFINEDTTLCLGETYTVDATIENGTSYLWSTGLREPIATFTATRRYDVAVTINDECVVEDWVRVTFNEAPTVQLGNDTTICQRSSGLVLKPVVDFEDVELLWNNGSTSDSIIVNRAGAFTVQIENECGTDETSILVNVEDCRNFYMPNAFSPNLNGINDVIFPFTETGDLNQISSYKIFNRWGVQVHSIENGIPNNPDLGWDGTYRNEPAEPGIYVYEIILQFRDGQESLIKGDFTLYK